MKQMTSLEQIQKASGKEIAETFQTTLNAGEAAANYLMIVGWGYGIKAATEAASDFIETESDVDGLQKILDVVKSFCK